MRMRKLIQQLPWAVILITIPGSFSWILQPLPSNSILARSNVANLKSVSSQKFNHRTFQTAKQCRAQNFSLNMLVEPKGTDAFHEIETESERSKLRQAVRKMGPSTTKVISTGIIPAAALVGFFVTPGGRAFGAVGAAVAGLASTLAKRKLSAESKASVPAIIAELLESKGLSGVRPTDVHAIFDQYGLSEEEASDILVDIYRRYMLAMCKNSTTKTSDIRELRDLRQALNLNGEQVGDAIYAASTTIYKDRVLFTPSEELDDPYNPARKAVDKFLFLADRIFEVSDTEEAYEYEMGRIRKIFGLDAGEVKSRTLAIARPFYQKALISASERLDKLRPGALQLAEKTLGITKYLRDELHLEAFSREVKSMLENNKFQEGAVERLAKLGDAYGLDEEQQRREIEVITVPIYEQAVARELEQALEMQIGDADAARRQAALRNGRLASLQLGLALNPDTAERVLESSVRNAANSHFVAAAKFVRVGNAGKALEAAKELVAFVRAASVLVQKAFNLADGADPISNIFKGSMVDSATAKESGQLYRIYLKAVLSNRTTTLSESEVQDLNILARLMGQGSVDIQKVYQEEMGPALKSALEKGVQDGTYSPQNKAEYKKMVAGMQVPQAVVDEQAKNLYSERLIAYGGGGSILTSVQYEDLIKLQAFLDVKQEVVDKLHKQVCASAYQQSVLESMASTGGVITDELRSALDILRERLRLTKEDAKELLHNAVRIKIKPMVEQLCYEFERTYLKSNKRAASRGPDEGDDILVGGPDAGDLGIASSGAVNSDILALVDFYEENQIAETHSDGSRTYPVTAEGIGSPLLLEKIYQQFVVAAFSMEGKQAQRYVSAQAPFAGLLGLSKDKVDTIHSEIGSTVVNQFFKTQLGRGTSLGPRETALLASVGTKLGLSPSEFDKIVTSGKKKVLSYKIETAFQKPRLTANIAKSIRDTAVGVGLDLSRDLNVPPERLRKMFVAEAKEAIDGDGQLEDIEEIADAFGFKEEKAQEILVEMLQERAESMVKDAVSDIKQNNDAEVVKSISKLLAYCKLAGGLEVDSSADRKDLENVFNTYLSSRSINNDEEQAEFEADSALLRGVLGLSPTAVSQ